MSIMTDVRSVAADTRTTNILAGLPFEFVAQPSIVRIYAIAAAVGMFADVLVGGESLVSDSEVAAKAGFPTRDQDLLAEIGALPGERIFMAWRNSTAGAIIGQVLVDVLPV